MSRFTSHLGLRLREDGRGRPIMRDDRCTWEVMDPALVYEVGAEGSGGVVVVPAGTVTDLASIPWPVRAFLPPDGPWAKAAVLHDHLYATKGEGRFGRKQADGVLREAMEVLGVPAWKRAIIYNAVRLGGGGSWGG